MYVHTRPAKCEVSAKRSGDDEERRREERRLRDGVACSGKGTREACVCARVCRVEKRDHSLPRAEAAVGVSTVYNSKLDWNKNEK